MRITDSGRGISAENLPFIFDRFYKADKSRTVSDGGSGLGLSIVYKIVALHSGTITADSGGLGRKTDWRQLTAGTYRCRWTAWLTPLFRSAERFEKKRFRTTVIMRSHSVLQLIVSARLPDGGSLDGGLLSGSSRYLPRHFGRRLRFRQVSPRWPKGFRDGEDQPLHRDISIIHFILSR